MVYSGFETLTAVGVAVENFYGHVAVLAGFPNEQASKIDESDPCYLPTMGIDDQKNNAVVAGMMSWVDSSIAFHSQGHFANRTAFSTNRSLFLENVFVLGAQTLARFPDTSLASLYPATRWTRIERYAHGINPPPYAHHRDWELRAPTLVNGKRYAAGLDVVKSIHLSLLGPAHDMCSQHHWGPAALFPTFMMPAAVNVRADAGAIGDGVHDDGPIIQHVLDTIRPGGVVFLPRGIYGVSKPLRLGNGVSLIGVGKHLVTIVALRSMRDHAIAMEEDDVVPLVTVEGDDVTLAFLSITVWNTLSHVSALRWTGGRGRYRQVWFHRASPCGATPTYACHTPPVLINHPMMVVTGRKASLGRVYLFLGGLL